MTFNPNAPSTIGLEWLADAESLQVIDAATKNAAFKVAGNSSETIDQLIVPHQYAGPSSGYHRQWVDLYTLPALLASLTAPAVTELTFSPNEDKSKSNVTKSDFASTTNLYTVLDDTDDSGPPENTDYMVNSNYGGTATYRCQFNTAAISSSYRIVYIKFEIRAKGFDWSWQKPKIEFNWWNGSTDLGRFATINPEPDYIFRTRVLGPYYFDFYNEGRWLQPEVALWDNNTSRNLGVKLYYATAISRITLKVGVIPEDRVAVGIGARQTVVPSGRQTNIPMQFKTPLNVDNWSKANGTNYLAVVTRCDDPFAASPTFAASYAKLDSSAENPHAEGNEYTVTLTGQDGLISTVAAGGTACYGYFLGTSGSAQSSDSQPYHDLDAMPCHASSTLKQGVNAATSAADYKRVRLRFGVSTTPTASLTVKLKRTSDNVQMGGTATLTVADISDTSKCRLIGTRNLYDGRAMSVYEAVFDMATAATLASATDYYLEMASTSTESWFILWLDASASHSLTGNVTYGGSTNVATVAGVADNEADFEILVSSVPSPLSGFTRTVVTYDLPSNGGSTCETGTAQRVDLNWTSSSLSGSFLQYEVERSDDEGATWYQIAVITDEATSDFSDKEATPGIPELYRVRVVRTDGSSSEWTTSTAVTLASTQGVLLMVSNADPSIACGYVVLGSRQEYRFLSAEESVFMKFYERDFQVRFRPLEERGVQWTTSVLIYVSDPNAATEAANVPPDGAGTRAFDTLRNVGTASIPYVCVITPWGERLFGSVDITTGVQAEPAHYYVATLVFTQLDDEPSAVTV